MEACRPAAKPYAMETCRPAAKPYAIMGFHPASSRYDWPYFYFVIVCEHHIFGH